MSTTGPAPGWYPEPAGGGLRWWDGRAWTEHRGTGLVSVVAQPPLPAGTTTGTPWILLQALIPLAQVAAEAPYFLSFRALFVEQFALLGRGQISRLPPSAVRGLFAGYGHVFAAFGVTAGLLLVLYAAWVVLAVLDARRLERIEIVQPFSWAWSFLGLVYPIGRAVVLRRRARQGLAPIWVLIGAVVASVILMFVLEAVVLLPMTAGFASLPAPSAAACGC